MIQFQLLTFMMVEIMMMTKTITAYSQISVSSNNNSTNDGPKIYKALNMDLLVPQSFQTMQPKTASIQLIEKPLKEVEEKQEHKLAMIEKQPIYDKEQEQLMPQIYVTPPNEQMNAITLNNNDNNEIITKSTTKVHGQQNQKGKKGEVEGGEKQEEEEEKEEEVESEQRYIDYSTNKQQQESELQQQQQQQTQQQSVKDLMLTSTGRAASYRDSDHPFGQLITPLIKTTRQKLKQHQQQQQEQQQQQHILLPTSTSSLSSTLTSLPKVIYPLVAKDNIYQTQQEHRLPQQQEQRQQQQQQQQQQIENYIKAYKLLNNGGAITDRFTPGEAVATQHLKKHQSSYAPIGISTNKKPQNSIEAQSDMYSFPPNNINYSKDVANNSAKFINSYMPPPSGSLIFDNDNGNMNQDYAYKESLTDMDQITHLYENNVKETLQHVNHPNSNNDHNNVYFNDHEGDSIDFIGVLPAKAMLDKPKNAYNYQTIGDFDHTNNFYDKIKVYSTLPPGWLENHPKSSSEHPTTSVKTYYYEPPTEEHYKHIETINVDNNNDYHIIPDTNGNFDYQHHYPHHYPHYHQFAEYNTIPPQESRVKKYSYFYIGRKLWYIPLYFTVWFTFYVLWLILKSIARHKVNIPNHYVNRRSLSEKIMEPNQNESINQLTVNIWQKIEAFKEKYIK